MPPETLPEGAKKIYLAAEASAEKNTCKDAEDKDACKAKVAWKAVKNKYKKVGDSWERKENSEVKEFSLAISRASYNKESQEMRWRAVASDTFVDSYEDEMSIELFSDFIERMESKEKPPEHVCSDFWCGGIPYLSLSHYPDIDGKAVPGDVDKIFIDGNRLKSLGSFSNTPLGKACFDAVCEDLYGEETRSDVDKVRVSIAFIDWKHQHKSNGYIFERKSLDDVCDECLVEMILEATRDEKPAGKIYLAGHLIHLAMTRVPVNTRTEMEVDRSMAITRKEDAASIVGEELASEVEEALANEPVGKSAAVVVKSEEVEEIVVEETPQAEDVAAEVDEVEVSEEVVETPEKISEPEERAEVVSEPHILDELFEEFKSVYDEVDKSDPQSALETLQEPFNSLSTSIVNIVRSTKSEAETSEDSGGVDMQMLAELIDAKLTPITQQIGLLQAQLSETSRATVPEDFVPKPRSFQPTLAQQNSLYTEPKKKSETPKLRALAERSVGIR